MNASPDTSSDTSAAQAEVVGLCQDLIRIESVNFGDGSGPGERAAAEYVAEKLSEVGLSIDIIESEPGRASVVTRIAGADSSRGALLIHGHIDVVPAFADQWTLPPFAGEISDGCIWGRGAVDMKDTDAMVLAVIRDWMRNGTVPPRDIVLAFVADEEAGGTFGARYLVDNHADKFEGCTEAISEVGGFSLTVGGKRLYAIETAQKGMAWMRLTAHGRAGHGSMIAEDNAVTALCAAVARLGAHQFPIRMTKTMQAFLDEVADIFGITLDPDDMDATVAQLGSMARMIGATLRNTANPTMLTAGYKTNVIPGEAHAIVDGRFLPGYEEEFLEQVQEVVGENIEIEMLHHDKALETTFDGALVDAMVAALLAEDPEAKAIPYTLSGGTDAKSFSDLGMRCFGFAPLRLPADMDFSGMFHGVDERVPIDGLEFGVRVLDRFLRTC
ncbi:M20/M25/M40 family metallo-hydrolase [Sporichthya sp.]|uniref:M20/M25/M40 family metallo-hydrolase n=1 Tax=Sporichthya sp. TaxID=65475 RepID=UPI0017AF704F|nr:M20/M25/M40 family metallo-hydrolase [Sporichthya sp.]MBA3745650.1 M20/M25/M40 family metallo-hydrolase [Sporichthya sp.]